MPTWNEQQLKAIHTKQKNILVSASAGAGKTTVLIARLVDLVIKDNISIDHILAMTFTEAAANEMKKRLAAELYTMYSKSENVAQKQYISEQLSAISNAHISTIHSFCLSILQEFYYIINLSAKRIQTIMSPDDPSIQKAMDEVLRIQYEQKDDIFYQVATMFSARAESDDQLRNAIATLASNANAQSDPEGYLNTCLAMYDDVADMSQLPELVRSYFFDFVLVKCTIYQDLCLQLLHMYQTTYQEEVKKATIMEKKCATLPSLFDILKSQDYPAFKDAFIGICHLVPPPAPDKEDAIYTQVRKQLLALEDTMLERLFDASTYLQDSKKLRPIIAKLIEMCKDYRRIFAQMKEDAQCIDFDDMEHYALAILKANNHQVAKHYQALFDEIMVDEFQDSNDVQNELVTLIARPNNVFRVGDIKQSIYGFRHAKPQLMRGLIEEKGAEDEVIYLSNNYRSKKMIVDFNNLLFKELMNLDGFDGSYRKEDDVETGIPAQLEGNYPIIFHAINQKSICDEEDITITSNALKASYIAHQIITIRKEEKRDWKDFVVLVRANARKEDMKRIFDELHIPYFIDVKSGFYQSNAVQIILSTLKALANPHDDLTFIACMTSPLFQMSAQEIADIKLQKEKTESFYAYMKVNSYAQLTIFEILNEQFYHISICDMLTQLYEVQDFYSLHTTMQERTNLDLLFEHGAQYMSQEGKGILAFLSMIEEKKHVQTAEAIPIGSEDDVVRVMSIHQSKGLQFPVVFLWSNSKQTAIEFKELFICDSELGIGLKYMDIEHRYVRSTLQRQAIEHKKDKEELEEEMRILYVALTRAQQQMHIVDCVKSLDSFAQDLSTTSIYQRGGYTSWILLSALAKAQDICKIKPVSYMWEVEEQEAIAQAYHEIATYAQNDHAIQFTTPSSTHLQDAIPTLSFENKRAMHHGTKLHTLIEELPNRQWTKQDIQEIAPLCSAYDMQSLLYLSENPLYRRACAYQEVHHEMPFMIQDETTILHGYMDFVAIGEDIIIIDFKSDKVQTEQELLDAYTSQLQAYAKAMHSLYPSKEIHTYLYSLSLHKEIKIENKVLVSL